MPNDALTDAVEDQAAGFVRHKFDDILDKAEDEIAKMKDGLKKTLLTHAVASARKILDIRDVGEFADDPAAE